jgi:hypothetical protein
MPSSYDESSPKIFFNSQTPQAAVKVLCDTIHQLDEAIAIFQEKKVC